MRLCFLYAVGCFRHLVLFVRSGFRSLSGLSHRNFGKFFDFPNFVLQGVFLLPEAPQTPHCGGFVRHLASKLAINILGEPVVPVERLVLGRRLYPRMTALGIL